MRRSSLRVPYGCASCRRWCGRRRSLRQIFGGGDGGLFQFGVIAEAEVVVGGEIDDALAVIGTDGGLLVVEFAQFEEGSPLAEVVELGSEMSELGAFGGCSSHGINRKPLGAGWFWG